MRMTKLATALAAALAVVGLLLLTTVSAHAQNDNVAATKHNLSVTSGGGGPGGTTIVDYGEICVYCHTPHGGQTDAPLWNRSYGAGPYDMYSSSTIDMTMDAQPTGISLACLSCHDGTIGLDVVINPPNSFTGTAPTTVVGTNTMPSGGFTLLGTDLRNDHPISVTYDPTADTKFNSKADVVAGGLKLFGDGTTDKVQCASCHNPHESDLKPFLRKDNAASALCLTCHIK